MGRSAAVAGLVLLAGTSYVAAGASTDATTTSRVPKIFTAVDDAQRAGLARRNRTYMSTQIDYDRDGDQDVWIGYHGRGGRLWSNRGDGTYRRVAESAWPADNVRGKTIDRHACDWADVDRNGRPDAYCSTGRFVANIVKSQRDNELWLQGGRGEFREVGTAWGVGDVCGRGRFVAFLDANGDEYPDLFLGNETPRPVPDVCNEPGNGLPNEQSKIFLNIHGTGFRYAPRYWHYGAGPGTECAQVMDFDRDGWDDLLACRSEGRTPSLYRNRAGHGFVDVTTNHAFDTAVTDATVADLDRDGDPDLILSTPDGFAYQLDTDGTFRSAVPFGVTATGQGTSVAVGDADGDGDLDVYGMVGLGHRSNPDDFIWLNNSVSFSTSVRVPSAGGLANEVTALVPRANRRAAFLALNGFGRANDPIGPSQLIRLRGTTAP